MEGNALRGTRQGTRLIKQRIEGWKKLIEPIKAYKTKPSPHNVRNYGSARRSLEATSRDMRMGERNNMPGICITGIIYPALCLAHILEGPRNKKKPEAEEGIKVRMQPSALAKPGVPGWRTPVIGGIRAVVAIKVTLMEPGGAWWSERSFKDHQTKVRLTFRIVIN